MRITILCATLLFTIKAWSQNPMPVTTKTVIPSVKMNQLSIDYNSLDKELQEIKIQQAKVETLLKEMESLNQMMKTFSSRLKTWEKQVDKAGGTSQSQLLQATKQMESTQMSFNIQYLGLQKRMEDENRRFTMISNIMKTKHETVKNSISNIR